MSRSGLISDQRFAECYTRSRCNKGYGPLRISMELQARGISPETIAEVLQITDNTWLAEVQKVWRKHFKGRLPADFVNRAKQMRFLQYRGFTRDQIESVFHSCHPRAGGDPSMD
jgi:regulatory protein